MPNTNRSNLVTFDVFDTVLTRLVHPPSQAFLTVGRKIEHTTLWPNSRHVFQQARISAEDRARRFNHPRDINLGDIYRELAFFHDLNQEVIHQIIDLEMETEEKLLIPVPDVSNIVNQARKDGSDIGFISDMYLPTIFIKELLIKHGIFKPGDRIWVSSESGSSKQMGDLYDLVRQEVQPLKWTHHGDNMHSDVAVPTSKHINACHVTITANHPRELRMVRAMRSSAIDDVRGMFAAASRAVRLQQNTADKNKREIRDLAATVGAPILTAYVIWVLHTAQQRKLERIWFCARDGQVLLRIAQELAKKMQIDIPMGYLFSGRQVVHLAALVEIDEPAIKWMTGGSGVVSLAALLERVGLQVHQVAKEATDLQLPMLGAIGWENADKIRILFNLPKIRNLVLEAAQRRREVTFEYFKSCGLIDGQRCAIVDVGWRGSILRSLFNLIGTENGERHAFLYFGLYGRPIDVPAANMQSFAFDHSVTPHVGECGDIPALTSLIEIFCLADHAPAMGIVQTASGPAPHLREGNGHQQPTWDVPFFQECAVAFAKNLAVTPGSCPREELVLLCKDLLTDLAMTPTRHESNLLGQVVFHDDQAGSTAERFATAYTMADLRATFRTGELPEKALAWWRQGALMMTSAATKRLLLLARRLGKARQNSCRRH